MKKIALVGLPGTGKSTVASMLKEIFGWNWIDLDEEVERLKEKKISTLIREEGEQKFREYETQALERVLSLEVRGFKPMVLSLGGGVLLSSRNTELLKKNCTTVCLEASRDTILERVIKDEESSSSVIRPLLAGGRFEEISQRLDETIANRRNLYSQADIFISTEKKVEDVCKDLVDLLSV